MTASCKIGVPDAIDSLGGRMARTGGFVGYRWSFASAVALATVLAAGIVPSHAPALDPTRSVEDRQSEMKRLGGALKTISEFVRNDSGSLDNVKVAAGELVAVGRAIDGFWHVGTAVGVGDSEASPRIWEQRAEVTRLGADLLTAAEGMAAAAAGGDKSAIGKQLQAVGGTCKACHDTFRQKP